MKFYQKLTKQIPTIESPSGFYLVRDLWNDYWKYQTMFDLYYIENKSKFEYIGQIKIGKKDLPPATLEESGHELLDIPGFFNELSDDYFSVGQSSSYYEKLKKVTKNRKELETVLRSMRDMALDFKIYEQFEYENSMRRSITRDVSRLTIKGQYNRIITGQAKLTPYKFGYNLKNAERSLDFIVTPNNFPPSNVHVLIGRNGVGKSHLLQSMIRSVVNQENDQGYFTSEQEHDTIENVFASLIGVSFGSFDDELPSTDNMENSINYHYVGFKDAVNEADEPTNNDSLNSLATYFYNSLENIRINNDKVEQWYQALSTLERDSVFKELKTKELIQSENDKFYTIDKNYIMDFYKKNLSAGHKIVLLIITKLAELVEEKSLVLIDEPENHLHPPLLSLLTRAISDLLIYRNGVAIVVTHSPIIVQEVPKNCTWILKRNGQYMNFDRPVVETFGENTGILNREIFRLELTDSSYYDLIKKTVLQKNSVEEVFTEFNHQLGSEAKALVRTLMYQKERRDILDNEY
ncbi:AAA domain-containing protein, putative AbiEii toxin, Type IV TA system [Jeotgalicoccus aerolatus]|uniref:AAA domain-containing protein, putative AbiEii toxin, Type IV TA system n=1 Tax=Jeotgalicoccus aerolatus TaxID=709510 RepID=A0A1G8V5V2_9STAP|nr:AAA family ATPase [Jeotgalicoccus aerolatus]SDJ61421.1 AAA domain-containing protein, putative AbiEii toxin, Type IV TA system [Jeotgalicoccus aerolatus]